jgi:hypothetical protein
MKKYQVYQTSHEFNNYSGIVETDKDVWLEVLKFNRYYIILFYLTTSIQL